MNKRQLLAIRCGVGLIVLMGMIPPWVHTFDARSIHSRKPAGYQFIFTPPKPEGASPAYGVRLDVSRLAIQWVVTATAAAAFVLVSRQREKPAPKVSKSDSGKTQPAEWHSGKN
jgi:hypothetical protein